MQIIPSREELLARIESRYRCDIEKAKTTRDAAIRAITSVDASTLQVLASLLSDDAQRRNESHFIPAQSVSHRERVIDLSDDHDDESDDSSESSTTSYGEITEQVRRIATSMQGEFTVRDIVAQSESPPKMSTISGVLRKLERAGILSLVEQGSGKRPSRFRLASQVTEGGSPQNPFEGIADD